MSAVSSLIRVSVVVPALNEEKRIESFLEQCRAGAPHQIIVVDGGSDDHTPELAARHADIVLEQHGGLARQLNRGAAASDGDVLFFPYVDTHLPDGWHDEIRGILRDSDIAGGAFRLALDSPRLRFRIIALFANLRTSLGIGPLGDQAIFVHREDFRVLRRDVLFEDIYFWVSPRPRTVYDYDPRTDRFLMNRFDESVNIEIEVVVNFFDELRRLAPAGR